MKINRFVALLLTLTLALTLLAPAAQADDVTLRSYIRGQGYQYLTFGQYFTTKEGGMEPILWRVLAVSEGKALLLSEYVLDARPYLVNDIAKDDRASEAVEYEDSTVYSFLNEEFLYAAFTQAQRAALVDEGAGLVFILDEAQLTNSLYGFKNGWSETDVNRNALPTPFAAECCYVGDKGYCNYWVATPVKTYIRLVHYIGSLGMGNCFRTNVGIRVAAWVDTDMLQFYGGDGTADRPFEAE